MKNIIKAHKEGDRFSIWATKPNITGIGEGHVIFGQINKGKLILFEGQAMSPTIQFNTKKFFNNYKRFDVISHQGKVWP